MIAVVILLLVLALLRSRSSRFFFRWSRARGTAVLPSLYASPYFRSVLKNTRRWRADLGFQIDAILKEATRKT